MQPCVAEPGVARQALTRAHQRENDIEEIPRAAEGMPCATEPPPFAAAQMRCAPEPAPVPIDPMPHATESSLRMAESTPLRASHTTYTAITAPTRRSPARSRQSFQIYRMLTETSAYVPHSILRRSRAIVHLTVPFRSHPSSSEDMPLAFGIPPTGSNAETFDSGRSPQSSINETRCIF